MHATWFPGSDGQRHTAVSFEHSQHGDLLFSNEAIIIASPAAVAFFQGWQSGSNMQGCTAYVCMCSFKSCVVTFSNNISYIYEQRLSLFFRGDRAERLQHTYRELPCMAICVVAI